MPIYWSLKSIPELSNLPSNARVRVWQRVYRKTFLHWQTWLGLIACGICAGIGSYLGGIVGSSLAGAAIGGGIGGFVFSQASIHVARRYYKDVLLQNEGLAKPTNGVTSQVEK